MSTQSLSTPVGSLDARLLAEHRRIRELIRQLEHTSELAELLACLSELRSALLPHFLNEEAAGGFYDKIRSVAPGQRDRADRLERQHKAILTEMEVSLARGRADSAGPAAEVLAGAQSLARRLLDHETAEDHLLFDILESELGQGD